MNPRTDGLTGRFAVVKLWPKIKAAEDENVARLKVTAKSLGLECVEITPDGRLLAPPHTLLTQADTDFVIHLHFETPKAYDIFSFVALWNPLQFYHEWGYRRFCRNLLSHDDFLSCSATWTDDHIRRMTAHDPTRDDSWFTMYHSLSEPICEPMLGEHKIFYAGINWERLGKKKGRHQELLKLLDRTGTLRIFGPRIFQGVDVWEGYESYSGPIPFDGVSIIREINKCGIALVLSSDAHKQSELMSNRLFESLAGGALVICDENPFAKRHFGDTLLYIDTMLPVNQVIEAIATHVEWVETNPAQALTMAQAAQSIFCKQFALDKSLTNIYENLIRRRKQLENLAAPSDPNRLVALYFMMPDYSPAILRAHLASAKTQRHAGCQPLLLIDDAQCRENEKEIQDMIGKSELAMSIRLTPFFDRDETGRIRRRLRLGEIFSDVIKQLAPDALFCFVAPDEELLAEHVQYLVGALDRDPQAALAHGNALYRHRNDGVIHHDLQEELDYIAFAEHRPLGFGRFLFRRSALACHIHSAAFRYLDFKAIALLVAACGNRVNSGRASVICDIQSEFNVGFRPNVEFEFEIMRDYLRGLDVGRNTGPTMHGRNFPRTNWNPRCLIA